jgi:hypothetical protein
MKMKSVLAVLFLMVGAAVAGAATPPDQPFMRAALADLQTAKSELQAALHNKGGHRYTAAGLTNQAIGEVKAGIAYAQRHNHSSSLPDQPHMQAALSALKSALDNLNRAEADKGGHRANAMSLVNQAISEVKAGIEAGEGG